MGPASSGAFTKSREVPRSALVSETASRHSGPRPRAAASPTRTPLGGFVMACHSQGASTTMTPDPVPIDGLLVQHSGSGGGLLPKFGPDAGGGTPPALNSEDFDQSSNSKHVDEIILINDDNNDDNDSWDSERELRDLESFPGRNPPSSDNGEADDDEDAPMREQSQVAGSSRRGGRQRSSLRSTTPTSFNISSSSSQKCICDCRSKDYCCSSLKCRNDQQRYRPRRVCHGWTRGH